MISEKKKSWLDYFLSVSWASFIGFPVSYLLITAIPFFYNDFLVFLAENFPDRRWHESIHSFVNQFDWLTEPDNYKYFLIAIFFLFILFLVTTSIRNKRNNEKRMEEKYQQKLEKEEQEASLIKNLGAVYFSQRKGEKNKRASWNRFCELVDSETRGGELCILGAAGFETFGEEGAPLHNLTNDFEGRMRVLILNDRAKAIRARVDSLNDETKTGEYRAKAKKSFNFINALHKADPARVRIRTYDHAPSWKMVITDNHLWLQYYMPHKHVEDSSSYIFYRSDVDASLYACFRSEFDRLWVAAEQDIEDLQGA